MAQFVSDYLREGFRSYHQDEPLVEEDVEQIIRRVKLKFPDVSDEDIEKEIHLLFEVAELKTFRFRAEQFVEAYTEEEAKNAFANSSYNFAADAECEQIS